MGRPDVQILAKVALGLHNLGQGEKWGKWDLSGVIRMVLVHLQVELE